MRGACAGFLGELALRGHERLFVRLELSGRQFPEPPAGDVAILTQEAHARLRIERDHRSASGVMHDIKLGAMAVRQYDFVDRDVHNASAKVIGAALQAHARKPSDAGSPRTGEYL
jgi:hypothetical protein